MKAIHYKALAHIADNLAIGLDMLMDDKDIPSALIKLNDANSWVHILIETERDES